MRKQVKSFVAVLVICGVACTCKKTSSGNNVTPPPKGDSSIVNLSHLNYLYTPVTFPDGKAAAGVYIYSNAPNYTLVEATGEGFTCVDDVSRAILVYIRHPNFQTDTSLQNKAFNLIRFVLEMQSGNGYFYNFLQTNGQINTTGQTSINNAEWWSWRALQALTEALPVLNKMNTQLAGLATSAIAKTVAQLKSDQVNIPQTVTTSGGVTIPQWLPAGSGTDQAAVLILALIPYCTANTDTVMTAYVKKLADGVAMMEAGDAASLPYSCILSWSNTWHAYGSDQAYALMKAGQFLSDTGYTSKGLAFVNNFCTWLLTSGMQNSFVVTESSGQFQLSTETTYPQIAYGIRPLVFAAAEAYAETNQATYADIAGHLAAWFLGANAAGQNMYSPANGIGYDGLSSPTSINTNSGAESTIEALLTMEKVEANAAIQTAMNKYIKK